MSSNQSAKVRIEIGSVQETLLIALWCRAAENRKDRPFLVDPKASEIVGRLDYDFSRMEKALTEYMVLISNITCRYCDDALMKFIADHPKAKVVNIGAGLDTTFHRVDNGFLRWYDLDLPDVIDLRKRLVPETDRSRCLARSVLDFGWFDEIGATEEGLFMFARGVFCYFDAAEMKRLFSALAVRFPGADLLFNSYNVVGKWGGNNLTVKRTGIKDAPLKWAVGSAGQLARRDSHIEIVDEWRLFSRIPRDPSWKRGTVMMMSLMDTFRSASMVHLRFR